MLANRVRKRFKHLSGRFRRQNIEAYRLYDRDIPEIRAVVDWYAGHPVIGEYTRTQSGAGWLPVMGKAVADALDVSMENVHLKKRKAGKQDGKRYERFAFKEEKIILSERDLKFSVNLNDFIDTGLFSDHRNTRQMVREMAGGKAFLNLYCYTGTFSCYAAKGGAKSTVSVDRSETLIRWAGENFKLNSIPEENNRLVQADTFEFLKRAKKQNQRFDLAVADPPSYSDTRRFNKKFDLSADHPLLLREVISLMNPGGIIIFSTNHQNFSPQFDALNISGIEEITDQTIPEDYISKRKKIHRCWKIRV